MQRQYLCIDLKSFYASVECVERGLDPMTTDLVVADPERSSKTICLAVSPSLKARGVSGRARVFEIPETFDYIMAPPRMAKYVEYSAAIYGIYLRYLSKDDIHVYSIDEAFMDVTGYLSLYGCTARELGERIRAEVLDEIGIPATCGIGPNLYLAKLALDITAKHSPDFFGELDADSFRGQLWDHKPLTDFWRIGRGIERRLHALGIHTMGELALYPRPERLYDEFGIDAEILIDHAWGYEPVTIADIKAYEPKSHSMTNAQVLGRDYSFDDALLVAKEMADASALELVAKRCTADSVTLAVRYAKAGGGSGAAGAYGPTSWNDAAGRSGAAAAFGSTGGNGAAGENDPTGRSGAAGENDSTGRSGAAVEGTGTSARRAGAVAGVHYDPRDRRNYTPDAHGTARFPVPTNSREAIVAAVVDLFEERVDRKRAIHNLMLNFNGVEPEGSAQLSLFSEPEFDAEERSRQEAILDVKRKFGKNALLKGIDLMPQATQRDRNRQLGGHKSGE